MSNPCQSEEESFIANRIEIFARQFGHDILPAVELFANSESVTPLLYGIRAYRVRPETTSFQHSENGGLLPFVSSPSICEPTNVCTSCQL